MKNIDKIDKYTSQNFTNIILKVKDMVVKDSKKEDILRYLNGFVHENSLEIKELKYAFDKVYRFINDHFGSIIIKDKYKKNKYLKYFTFINDNKGHSKEYFKRFLIIIEKEINMKKDIPEMQKVIGLAKILLNFGDFLMESMDKRIEIDTNRITTSEMKAIEIDKLDTTGRNYDDEGSYLTEINRRFQKQVKILLEKE